MLFIIGLKNTQINILKLCLFEMLYPSILSKGKSHVHCRQKKKNTKTRLLLDKKICEYIFATVENTQCKSIF